MGGIGIADDGGNGTRFQRLFHGPQQACGFPQRDGDEAVARQAEALETMAIEPAEFTLMCRKPAPQQRAAFLRIAQAAQCERQCKAHGGGLVAMGARRHVMKAAAQKALRGQVPV